MPTSVRLAASIWSNLITPVTPRADGLVVIRVSYTGVPWLQRTSHYSPRAGAARPRGLSLRIVTAARTLKRVGNDPEITRIVQGGKAMITMLGSPRRCCDGLTRRE